MSHDAHPRQAQPAEAGLARHQAAASLETARRRLLSLFDRLRGAPAGTLGAEARRELELLHGKFEESRFHLVLLGQFKRGKTTLLNSLIGVDLLPTGVLPLTSIVTVVQYRPEPLVRVRFASGAVREISPGEIADYVTERGNPQNKKGVAEVEVFHPAARLEDGLCLIDTPGIGSIFEYNTRVAYQFVPRADAAIFVLSPESPLSQAELEFLHHIRGYVEKVFFVLNKVDQVSDAERDEILEFAEKVIREQVPAGELRFLCVSARQALEGQLKGDSQALSTSSLPVLMDSLDHFLASHGGDVLARSTCAALRRLLGEELLSVELESRALTLSFEELAAKIETIQKAWAALDVRHREAGHVLRGEIRALEMRLEQELQAFAQAEKPHLVEYMKAQLEAHRGAPKQKLVRKLEEALRGKIEETFEDWKIKEQETIEEVFESLTARFTREATRTLAQIQQAAAEQFGFAWTATPLPERLSAKSDFYVHVEELMSWGLGRFPYLLPGGLFARYLARRLEQTCLLELGRNVGRLRAHLGDRLERSMNDYLRALDRHLKEARESVLASLQRAAALKKSSEAEGLAEKEALATRQSFLRQMDEELAQIQEHLVPASQV